MIELSEFNQVANYQLILYSAIISKGIKSQTSTK